jgi:hypothetical protein
MRHFASNMAEQTERKAFKASKNMSKHKVNKRSQVRKWKDTDVKELISLMQEETILFSLNNAKTPKEKSACYKVVHAELDKKGNNIACYVLSYYPLF